MNKIGSGKRPFAGMGKGVKKIILMGLWAAISSAAYAQAQLEPGFRSIWDRYDSRREDVSKRDAVSKHFRNADGSFTAVIGAGPIHYVKDGGFETIDTRVLTNTGADAGQYPYANTANIQASYFGATAAAGIQSRTEEGTVKEFLNTRMYWQVNGQPQAMQNSGNVAAQIWGDKVLYPQLYTGVDAEFIVEGGKRKLNYLLADAGVLALAPVGAEYLVFVEEIQINPTWSYAHTVQGISIKDAVGKVIYRYENPFSNDQTDLGLYTDNTEMEVSQTGNVLTVSIKVKAAWLLAAERVFPIVVDPTAVVYPNNATYWTCQTNSGGTGTSGSPAAGRAGTPWYRSYVKFNTTSLPACSVSAAILSLKPTNIQGTYNASNALGICQSKYDLANEDFFPAYADVYNAIALGANVAGDYAAITTAGTVNVYRDFDLGNTGRTDIAAKAGGLGSFFVAGLRPGWAGGAAVTRYMVFGDHTSTANRPYLTVTYTQTEAYCHPTHIYANCAGFNDCLYIGISNVSLGTINNTTTYNNIPIGYNSYAGQSTDVIPGTGYTLNVTFRDGGGNGGVLAAWADWNQDGTFQTSEFLGTSGTLTNTNVYGFTFTVPSGATLGSTRLRVRSAYNDQVYAAGDACRTMEYGETEDYSLNIIPPPNNTLTVSGAGAGGSPANGSNSYTPGTSITASAGTNPGYILTGWTGTGSVPASGTGSSVTFTINLNSTITWNWVSATATGVPVFHNYGGTDQLAFNNSRFAVGASPVFRMSHTLNAATTYQIEMNTAANFTGTSWVHSFSGTYAAGAEANFALPGSVGFVPVSGTTYYVRARTSGDGGNLWSGWSAGTYSFTHHAAETIPNWYQTTQAQCITDSLLGTEAIGTGIGLLASAGGNPIVNPTFTNTGGWTTWKTSGTDALIEVSSTDCSNCPGGTTRNLKMYLWTASVLSGDMMIVSQQVDLTGVDQISFNANSYYGPNGSNPGGTISNLRFIIGGASNNETGTVMHTTSQAYCPTFCTNSVSDQNIVINTSGFTGVQTIKFVVKFTQTHSTSGLLSFYVNNVVASANASGTAISTPVHLGSVQDAAAYDRVEWTQTLNGGAINLKMQQHNGTSWVDVPGYTAISAATDGLHTYSLASMSPYAHVRMVAALDGSPDVELNNWSIKFPDVTPLPVELVRFGATCQQNRVRLDWTTASERNNAWFLVQRSNNLQHWENVGKVAGHGNSNEWLSYTLFDDAPYRQTAYYRLIQTDYDGTSETFAPVSIVCEAAAAQVLSLYPNPTDDRFTVSVFVPEDSQVRVNVTDLNGKVCLVHRQTLPQGMAELNIACGELPAGVYLVAVRVGEEALRPLKLVVR